MATTLGSVAVGSIVYLNESGSPVAFYVAKHDYESALNGAGRTLLVRKDCHGTSTFNVSTTNAYANGHLDKYITETWLPLLDSVILENAQTTKLYYTIGGGDYSVTTLDRTAFALSLTELGLSATGANAEGTAVPVASALQIAYLNGSATQQWTRSPNTTASGRAWEIKTDGTANSRATTSSRGARPALTLPAAMGVDDNGNVTEPVAASAPHGAMIDDVACPITECYVEIDGVRCPVPYGLTTIDGVTMTIPFAPSTETIEQYPSIVGNLTYTGSAQSPQWADYDSSKMSIGGSQSGTNAGSYTTTFTPLEGYVWPDGSTDAYSVTWSIAKAAGKVTLSKTSISLSKGESTTFTVTRSGDGAISVSNNSLGLLTSTLSGTTVTVKALGTGRSTVTVSVAEGTNHLAASATCVVTAVVKQYTVTIRTSTPGYTNAAYASFRINGTEYSGSPTVTLTVDEGTAWSAHISAAGLTGAGVYMNGKITNELSGAVTSNMDVDITGYYYAQYGALAYYIYITTS